MNILGIETSCDETAAAVVRDGKELLSNVIVSQIDIMREFGGVVPEVAARNHIDAMLPVLDKAINEASQDKTIDEAWSEIDGIAVTCGPGLLGSLLVGVLTARTLALIKGKPLYAINHVEAHTYANWLVNPQPVFPVLSLTVSGGHSQLVYFRDHFDYELIGQTQDDAVGEAFDKVAKMLGLPYPGGPSIAEAALEGNAEKYDFPKSRMANPYDFSFSGLKTAVLRHLQEMIGKDYSFPSFEIAPLLTRKQVVDTAASFQRVAVETLVDKAAAAYHEHSPTTVVIAGGVAANQELRRQLNERLPLDINYAPPVLCTDNAAMIATLGCFHAEAGKTVDPLTLEAFPSLSM